MAHDPCPNDRVINMIEKRLDKMDQKLDVLLEDRWKRVGATVLLSTIIPVIVTILGFYFK